MTRLICGSGLFAMMLSFGWASPPQASGIVWLDRTKKAFEEARRTGKPIWALFL